MAEFTSTQGRYLAFIHAYTRMHGYPPAESEIAMAMCVSPPSVNQMVKTLEKKGLILRQPGQARALQVIIPEDQIPPWNKRGSGKGQTSATKAKPVQAPPRKEETPANLYVLSVYLMGGPMGPKFANKVINRVIEIRGDQTLEQLHAAIFQAYDRWKDHSYQFQLGKRPFDPEGPNFGMPEDPSAKEATGSGRTTLDSLGLAVGRVFGYWFDFGNDWFHQVQVERIEQAIPTVTYPRLTRRIGKSPLQYDS